ncbi:MAG: hypothetical protein RBT76_00070 [candidate division Zixibacteria bacterium]|jgi:hypothetical protein|nr:hypothetical protein [candidate division Zixibacteria bacterium]
MYSIDKHDRVEELTYVPQSSVGAPEPVVLASEHSLLLAYSLEHESDVKAADNVLLLESHAEGPPVALVTFVRPSAHLFGPPNDEAFAGHPLSERGLERYGVFEVHRSSWIRQLERMNAVHPKHDKKWFMEGKRHFIFTFHDSTFECIARGMEIAVGRGWVMSVIREGLERLR